jgi:hypothetical protein
MEDLWNFIISSILLFFENELKWRRNYTQILKKGKDNLYSTKYKLYF